MIFDPRRNVMRLQALGIAFFAILMSGITNQHGHTIFVPNGVTFIVLIIVIAALWSTRE